MSFGTFRMPVLPPKGQTLPDTPRRRAFVPPKQRRRQNDTDLVLPSDEQLLRLQHSHPAGQLLLRGSQEHLGPAPPVPPTGTPSMPRHCPRMHLPRQIVKFSVYYALLLSPPLSLLLGTCFHQPDAGKSRSGSPGSEAVPVPVEQQPSRFTAPREPRHQQHLGKKQPIPGMPSCGWGCCCHQ